MIIHNRRDRTVSLADVTGIYITVTERSFAMYGLRSINAAFNNDIKVLVGGKWDYVLNHAVQEE